MGVGHPNLFLKNADLVTLAIAGNFSTIIDENRIIAHIGLRQIKETKNPGIKALLASNDLLNNDITIKKILFYIIPQFNSS